MLRNFSQEPQLVNTEARRRPASHWSWQGFVLEVGIEGCYRSAVQNKYHSQQLRLGLRSLLLIWSLLSDVQLNAIRLQRPTENTQVASLSISSPPPPPVSDGWQAVALSSAALLAEVIVNGSAEELELSKLQRQANWLQQMNKFSFWLVFFYSFCLSTVYGNDSHCSCNMCVELQSRKVRGRVCQAKALRKVSAHSARPKRNCSRGSTSNQ